MRGRRADRERRTALFILTAGRGERVARAGSTSPGEGGWLRAADTPWVPSCSPWPGVTEKGDERGPAYVGKAVLPHPWVVF